MSSCKHNLAKRKLILAGKDTGTHNAYCSQQCKSWARVTITKEDILNVYPRGRPNK